MLPLTKLLKIGKLTYYTVGDEDSFSSGASIRRFESKPVRLDKEWVVDLAGSCFIGDAVRWYEDFSEDVQNDWGLLRQVLQAKCPKKDIVGSPSLK